ncbi:MAG: dihydrofolate reductase [Desulfobulbaceae bacterium]|nr:dihydrofolate reductase [Desulfobulbaceae bacterium]
MPNNTEIILIAAMAANRVIGKDNTIPWDIPGEQARFKQMTMGHALIMGRKTWQSIGRPLPGRRNIVITRNLTFQAPGAQVAHSLDEGIALCTNEKKVFIIGGEQLYRLALSLADTLILTTLPEPVAGDAWFPRFSSQTFSLVGSEQVDAPMPYTINTYQRTER